MKYLEYDIKNMVITPKSGNAKLISGAVNYFGLKFKFDDEFSDIPGTKAVEFYKARQSKRVTLTDGMCAVPNELLKDKNSFEMRVICGNTIGTQWAPVSITESGAILPDEPEEEAPEGTEYVRTPSGESAVPYIRGGTNGLEYSQNGEDWNSGVSGVPEVPARPKDAAYLRKNGDWVDVDEYLLNREADSDAIKEISVDGTPLEVTGNSVNIDLSQYAKKSEIEGLQTLQGDAETVDEVDYGTTDISDVITSFNTLISALKTRGVIA